MYSNKKARSLYITSIYKSDIILKLELVETNSINEASLNFFIICSLFSSLNI